MTVLIIILVLVGLFLLWLWSTYNGLVKTNVRADEAWSDITVQLKRRADLVPNLVETVKGYAKHEREAFDSVTKARASMLGAQTPAQAAEAENMFQSALKSIFAVAEAYPELKASENFRELQAELTDTEDKIQASRRFYNGAARELNIKIKVFPTNMFAQRLGFKAREFFEVADAAAVAEPTAVKF